jgi:hypothetical protein
MEQLEEANFGMHSWDMSIDGLIIMVIGILIIAWRLASLKGEPSDFFLVFYSLIVLISFLSLYSVSGKISDKILVPAVFILFAPLLTVSAFREMMQPFRVSFKGIISSSHVERVVFCLVFAVIVLAYFNSPSATGFDITESYVRRLEGRTLYGGSMGYALAMTMNGLVPFLAFRGGLTGKNLLLVSAVSASVFFFWLVGVKAPFFYVMVAYLVGLSSNGNRLKKFTYYLLIAILGLWVIVLLEWDLFDNYSLLADYLFRRLFAVQAQVQGFYLDFLFNKKPIDWYWLTGSADTTFQPTFFIGKMYLNNAECNANTNTFLYNFVAGGVGGYLLALLIVPFILALFDQLWRSSQNNNYLFLGFIYGILLTEQAFTTAMVSSGVGLLFVLTVLEKAQLQSKVARKSMIDEIRFWLGRLSDTVMIKNKKY